MLDNTESLLSRLWSAFVLFRCLESPNQRRMSLLLESKSSGLSQASKLPCRIGTCKRLWRSLIWDRKISLTTKPAKQLPHPIVSTCKFDYYRTERDWGYWQFEAALQDYSYATWQQMDRFRVLSSSASFQVRSWVEIWLAWDHNLGVSHTNWKCSGELEI